MRLAMKALRFSKRQYHLDIHMTLYFAHYNFCHQNSSLKHPDASRKMREWTLLREPGITDRDWSLEELLTFSYRKMSVRERVMTNS